MSELNWADLKPIVIIESEDGLKVVEYERGEWEMAHAHATEEAMKCGGRAVVAMQVRELGSYRFLKEHGRI
jgi:hypothetical protein